MPLTPGTRLGPYEVVAAIAAGGMGEVYRARGSRLQRDVAVKVLPELFASDPDRRGRFECEAQAVAALSSITSDATPGRRDRAPAGSVSSF
jgi:serine/threonine protein kinase